MAAAKVVSVGVVAALALGQLATSTAATAAPAPRVTSVGGINLVPTPSGLIGMQEDIMSTCAIGGGCAARSWSRLVGPDANDPFQIETFQSNVGILPTNRLAHRDMAQLKAQYRTFIANSGFVGSIKQSTSKGLTTLKISGKFDQTIDDYVRIVQVRKGTRTVFISYGLDNRHGDAEPPASVTVNALTKKAKAVFKKNWSKVPHTVLP